jgi:NTP pyrophosphatase (non-canonical NTP hydrolase)
MAKTKVEYLLECVAEESGEIVQAAIKGSRFGLNDFWEPRNKSNRDQLILEINDLFGVVALLQEMGQLPEVILNSEAIEAKKAKLIHFMQDSRERGMLEPDSFEVKGISPGRCPLYECVHHPFTNGDGKCGCLAGEWKGYEPRKTGDN